MTHRISSDTVSTHLRDVLDVVSRRHDHFIIERQGQPLAAVIPMDELEALGRLARPTFSAPVLTDEEIEALDEARRITRRG